MRLVSDKFEDSVRCFKNPHARGVKAPNMSTINVTPNPVTVARCRMDGDGVVVMMVFGL